MKRINWAARLFLLAVLSQSALAQDSHPRNDVHWCQMIPPFSVLQEARFSAVYIFDVKSDGKPTNIRRASVPLISKKDGPLIDCINSWIVPASLGRVTAVFSFEWGWKGVSVTSGSFKISAPAVRESNSR